MKKVYKSPEAEIEVFDIYDGRVFTITPSEEGGIGSGDSEEEAPF